MEHPNNIVIVGASLAGGTAALTLREEGYKGLITLVGEEAHAPYERPALSKGFLTKNATMDSLFTRPIANYAQHSIGTRFGCRATRIDRDDHLIELDSGEILPFDRLLLTTGARNRRLPIPGMDMKNVFNLRTADDAIAIKNAIRIGGRAIVLGMGFIGSEVTAALRTSGMNVTVIEMLAAPLLHALGGDVSNILKEVHAEHGVTMIFEDSALALEGNGKVERVLTAGGLTLECDLVVFGFGTEPNAELATEAGLKVDGGILVDEFCRSSAEGIYAAGDVANHLHPIAGRYLRVEHWQNAILQAKVAARNMIGHTIPYDDVHWFWSNQYDERIHYAGFHGRWDRYVIRGSIADRDFSVFYMDGVRLVGVAAFNRPRDVRAAMPLLRANISVDERALASGDINLASLAPNAI